MSPVEIVFVTATSENHVAELSIAENREIACDTQIVMLCLKRHCCHVVCRIEGVSIASTTMLVVCKQRYEGACWSVKDFEDSVSVPVSKQGRASAFIS